MKKNLYDTIGKVALTFLIALSSIAMPTEVSANSEHPAYMHADAKELVYINETGLSEAELRDIEVEVIENMNVVAIT